MPISGRFYTSEELQTILGVTKQRVSDLARAHCWQAVSVGVLYPADEVDGYLLVRKRTEILNRMGWHPGPDRRALVALDEYDKDDNCPECGGLAVYRPGPDGFGPDISGEWACMNGHTGQN